MTLQSFERAPTQPKWFSQAWLLLLLSLFSLLLVSGRSYAVPTMEFFAAGGNPAALGPVLTPQVNTYGYNPNNPNDNVVTAAVPATTITYTLENQQFTSGTLANNGLVFGDAVGSRNIYIPLGNQGAPDNEDFASSRLNPANPEGIDVTANHGQRMALNASRLNGISPRNTTGVNGGLGHYFGDIVLTWNRPVLNPVVNVSGLGGRASTGGTTPVGYGISAQFELSNPPAGTTISRLAGRNMVVSNVARTIRNNAATLGATAANGGASGSVQILNNSPITSLRFRIYVRTDSTSNSTTWGVDNGDAFLFSSSSVDAVVGDLSVSKTNNVTSVTSGGSTTYTVRVTNDGPSTIDGAILNDVIGTGLSATGVACSAAASNRCTTAPNLANLVGAGVTLPALASGEFYEVNVTASVTAISGSVNNSATISLPASNIASNTGASCVTSGGITRSFNTTTGACTSTDTDTAVVPPVTQDPAINEARFTIVPNLPTIFRGGTGTQLVTITNNGPNNATGTIATFIPAPQTGVTVTSVSVVGGSACTFSTGEWSCPVGGVSNGANFQLNVTYSTTSASALGTAQQATIKVRSNEFNPGSGVGETLYKVWGTNQQNEIRPNGAFWVGYEGTGGSAQVGSNTDENTPVLSVWPATQSSPTGGYLTQAAAGVRNSVYGASSTTASPTIQRLVTNMSTDPDRSVQLAQINTTTGAGDNRRAWEYRTGIYLPTSQNLTFCAGNTSLGIDDNAYIIVDGGVQGLLDNFAPGGTVTANLNLSPGYHSITYRITNQNTHAGNAETAAGGYGSIGILFNGTCNTAGFDQWTNTAVPASINIIDAADLQITKTNSVTTVDAAGTTSYAVVVTNAGPSAANGAIFRDAIAAGLTKTNITCSTTNGAVCPTAANVAALITAVEAGVAIPTLPSTGTLTFTITANVTATSGSVANTATVTAPAGVTEIDPANNTATDTDTVTPRANLSVTKTNNVTAVNAGSNTTYTVVVANAGPSTASGAIFQDAAATNLTKTNITCSATNGAVCPTAASVPALITAVEAGVAIPTLPNTGTLTFAITATVNAISGQVANTATITAPAGTTEINAANNTETDTDTVTPAVDLMVVKSQRAGTTGAFQTAPLSVLVLGTVQYQLVFTNNGPSVVTGASLSDNVPTQFNNVSVVSATGANGATACSATNTVNSVSGTWSGPSGATCTVLIQVRAGLTTGNYTNTATTTVPNGTVETNNANNSSSVDTAIAPAADLAIVKTQRIGTTGAFVGTSLTATRSQIVQYRLELTNNGPTLATGATYSDTIPANITGLSVVGTPTTTGAGTVCAAPTFTGQTLNGTFTAAQGGTCSVVVQGTASTIGTITNTATITAVGVTDTVAGNNSSSVDLNITPVTHNCPTGSTATGSGFATSGAGLYRDRLFWLDWSCGASTQFAPSDTVNKSWVTPTGAVITATLNNIAGGAITPYSTGDWGGDDLPNLYGGVNPIGLRNVGAGQNPTFNIAWSANVNGIAIPVDLVMADAEDLAQSSGEFTQTTTNGDAWQLLESQGAIAAQFSNAAQTLRFSNIVNDSGGVALALSENTSSTQVSVQGGGVSAIAFAVAIGNDFGDAPASFGTTGQYQELSATGSGQPATATDANSIAKASLAFTTPTWLGTLRPDVERNDQHTANATGDDVAGVDDEDGVNPATLTLNTANSSFSVNVVVNNTRNVSARLVGWVDWNNDGVFQASEAAQVVVPANSAAQTLALNWTGLTGLTTGTRLARFRMSSDAALTTATPTGGMADGEVEDYVVTVLLGQANITGRVFNDNSGTTAVAANAYNGVQNTGELGLAGSTVELNNCAGTVIATTQTDGAGDYSFGVLLNQLSTPNFCITQTNLAGYTSVSGTAGYARATDTITIANTSALSYTGHNFGDARLNLVLTSDGQQTTTPSGTVSYPHILRSESVLSVGTLSTISTESPTLGWTTVLYRDTNCNGAVDTGESALTSAIGQLLPNQEICVVQRVNAPANATNGAQHVATLSASYTATVQDSGVLSGSSHTRTDTTLVGTAGLDMRKQVRVVASCPSTGADVAAFTERNTAQNGDFLEYQIIYSNRSTRNLSQLTVRDVAPSSTTLQSAICQSTPSGSGCIPPASAGVNGDLAWSLTNIAPAATGSVRFCVRVPPLAEPPIRQ